LSRLLADTRPLVIDTVLNSWGRSIPDIAGFFKGGSDLIKGHLVSALAEFGSDRELSCPLRSAISRDHDHKRYRNCLSVVAEEISASAICPAAVSGLRGDPGDREAIPVRPAWSGPEALQRPPASR
jgi:hypothetical protein